MTYKTSYLSSYARREWILMMLTIVDKAEEKKGDAELQEFLLPACNVVNEHGVDDDERKMQQMESSSAVTHG